MGTPLSMVLKQRHLPALDGLRGIFVMAVILFHGGITLPGDLGVQGFFVLSGFLITWLLMKERDRKGQVSLRQFYMRRALRIFPAYFVFIALSIGADYALGFGSNWGRTELVSALTYTVNYDNAFTGHDHPVAHAWSLAIEEQFYLLWPLLFLALARADRLRTGLVVMIVAALCWRLIAYGILGLPTHYVYNAFDTRLDALAIGCLIATLCVDRRFVNAAEHLARRAWYPVITVSALWVSRMELGDFWHYTVGFTVDAVLLSVLLLQLMQLHAVWSWRWLSSRAATWIGLLSYPLYLWHLWGLSSADNLLPWTDSKAAVLASGIALSFCLAATSYYVVEQPFLKLKKRFEAIAASPPRQTDQLVASAGGVLHGAVTTMADHAR